MATEQLEYIVDDYNCVQIIDDRLTKIPVDTTWFDNALKTSLYHWNSSGYKAIWLQLSSPNHSHLIPNAMSNGFYPHHCQPHYIMFVKWIHPIDDNKLPAPPSHCIGVGAVVINSKNEMLMVQETTGPAARYNIWKLPGGLVDSNETIKEAVIRELKEETGVNARFKSLCCMLEMLKRKRDNEDNRKKIHPFYVVRPARGSNATDIYCFCLCEIIGDENDVKLIKQNEEIADLKWIPIDEIFKMRLWKLTDDGEATGAWSEGLKIAVDVHNGKTVGLTQKFLPWGFRRGKASLYASKL